MSSLDTIYKMIQEKRSLDSSGNCTMLRVTKELFCAAYKEARSQAAIFQGQLPEAPVDNFALIYGVDVFYD